MKTSISRLQFSMFQPSNKDSDLPLLWGTQFEKHGCRISGREELKRKAAVRLISKLSLFEEPMEHVICLLSKYPIRGKLYESRSVVWFMPVPPVPSIMSGGEKKDLLNELKKNQSR